MVSINKSSVMYNNSKRSKGSSRCLSCPLKKSDDCVVCPFNRDYDELRSKSKDGDYSGFPENDFSSKRVRGNYGGLELSKFDFFSNRMTGNENLGLRGEYFDRNTLRSNYQSVGNSFSRTGLGYESKPLGYSLSSGSGYVDSGCSSGGCGDKGYESSASGFHSGYE